MHPNKITEVARCLGLTLLSDAPALTDVVALGKWLLHGPRNLYLKRCNPDDYRLIAQDIRHTARVLEPVVSGAPSGDPRTVALIISSFPTIWGIKMEGMLSLALRLAGIGIKVLNVNANPWMPDYHRLFGNREIVEFNRYLCRRANRRQMITLQNPLTVPQLMQLTYRGVDIGRIILTSIMYRHKFSQFDLSTPGLRAEMAIHGVQAQQRVLAAERLLEDVRPHMAVVLEKGFSPSAEIVGACLAKNIPVIQYVNSQDLNGLVLKRYHRGNRHNHPFSLDWETWERVRRMPWTPEHERRLLQELEKSYKSGEWFNRKFLHDGKRIKTRREVQRQLGLDPAKKTAVIFSHVLWDATFFFGDSLFADYETWLLESVRAACANPAVNWVIKLHPDLVWKLKNEGHRGELRDLIALRHSVGCLPDHVKVVMPDTDISTYSFFGITDYCLTVRGTIGIEMACFGVPVLTAGTGRYSHLGFTIDSASPAEYLEHLRRVQDTPAMTQIQIELARRFAYALFQLRPLQLHSFRTVNLPRDCAGHVLAQNLEIRVHNFAQFAAGYDVQRFATWVASPDIDYLELFPDREAAPVKTSRPPEKEPAHSRE